MGAIDLKGILPSHLDSFWPLFSGWQCGLIVHVSQSTTLIIWWSQRYSITRFSFLVQQPESIVSDQIRSDNSPILATCLWVWLHQNFNSSSDKFVMDWFIYSFERWQKCAHLTDCNAGWEVTNSKFYLSVNVPSRNGLCESPFYDVSRKSRTGTKTHSSHPWVNDFKEKKWPYWAKLGLKNIERRFDSYQTEILHNYSYT